jgi:hypothetical protein
MFPFIVIPAAEILINALVTVAVKKLLDDDKD